MLFNLDCPIVVEDGYFAWESNDDSPTTLKNINIRIQDGSMVAIVGPVGTGKSSLLSAFLGEINKNSGRVNTTVGET
jgi:ATP-binding cassette subfamily C (CFTR/MRP) protein 1